MWNKKSVLVFIFICTIKLFLWHFEKMRAFHVIYFFRLLHRQISFQFLQNFEGILHNVYIFWICFEFFNQFNFFAIFSHFLCFYIFGHKYPSPSQNFSPLHSTWDTIQTNICTNFEAIIWVYKQFLDVSRKKNSLKNYPL